MSILQLMLFNAGLVVCAMLAVWLISLLRRDVSIVDIVWGLGFVAIAWLTYSLAEGGHRASWLAGLTTVWGLRLAGYLAWRNLGKPEDYRYRAMREKHGPMFPISSLLYVFGIQGVAMWLVSLPIQNGMAGAGSQRMTTLSWVGVLVWLVGFLFEAVGDLQLARFKADESNRGKVLNRGLWRYTRHPNYFGDFLVWWGLFLVSIGSPIDLWTVISPLAMSFFLVRVTGVALLDRNLSGRSAEYMDYMQTTSSFFPLPPRRPSRAL